MAYENEGGDVVGFEDVQGSAIEKKGGNKEISSVSTGRFVGPEGNITAMSKQVRTGKPVKCESCGQQAIVRPNFTNHPTYTGSTNLCQRHWDQAKHNTESYESPYWLRGGEDEANQIRTEDYLRRLKGRNAASAAHFEATGEHVVVQTPGRPQESEEHKFNKQEEKEGRGYDPVSEVVKGKGRNGGRTKLRPIPQQDEDQGQDLMSAALAYNDSYGDEQDYFNAIQDLMS